MCLCARPHSCSSSCLLVSAQLKLRPTLRATMHNKMRGGCCRSQPAVWLRLFACDDCLNVAVWLTGGHVHVIIKPAAHWGTRQEVQVGHVEEHRLDLTAGGAAAVAQQDWAKGRRTSNT